MSSKLQKKQKVAQAKELNELAFKSRSKIISEAKSYDFLNAVFCIHSYNTRSKLPPDKTPDISPYDIFVSFDEKEYALAIEKCEKLLDSGIKYGDLALKAVRYRNGEEYRQVIELFRLNNLGFNDENLDKALHYGMTIMK